MSRVASLRKCLGVGVGKKVPVPTLLVSYCFDGFHVLRVSNFQKNALSRPDTVSLISKSLRIAVIGV